jgi:SAM-dependent methyltransferase
LRLGHFERLRPVCPVCRAAVESGARLEIAHVAREVGGHIVEGILHCTNSRCQREYPVLDGVPLLLANLRQYVADGPLRLLLREDLSPLLESVIGDCCGAGSDFDQVRQQVSAYTWDHYGDLDPDEAGAEPRPGTMLATLETGWQLAQPIPGGPVLEVGCAVGRGSLALAQRTDELVLGVDLHFPMLRLAARVLRDGTVRYARRRVGLVYDRRVFDVRFERCENVDFWACDAAALPFAPATFAAVAGLNVLDSVYAPRELLDSIAQVLTTGGKAVLTSPYDWSPAATPLEGWLGGHSQRSPAAGASEASVRALLTAGASPAAGEVLRLYAERDDLPWHVRLHDRSSMSYRVHLVVATRE